MGGLGRVFPGGDGRQGRRTQNQTVYVLVDAEKGTLKPVSIRTGISDGHYTQVVEGDLKPGDPVVTGLATAKVQQQGNLPGMGGSRPPGMGRF
jgi:HlyD family secretion protein